MNSIMISIIALLIALAFHEFAHALMAYKLGDRTAANENRLSLNPLSHIDPLGTILLPIILIITHSPVVFGWAKPVPINPRNFKNYRMGMILVSLSGPGINLFLGITLSFFMKLLLLCNLYSLILFQFLEILIIYNVFLAVFNLIPIPPFDGYKALAEILPHNLISKIKRLESYGPLLLIVFLYFNIIDKIITVPSNIILNMLL